jgi:thiamine-monophosphate kinase
METDLIAWLRKRVPPHPNVLVGIGDDAAVLRLPAGDDCLVTVDMLTDQVDFRLEEADPRWIGRKALAVNLSDIAAMAGVPVAAFVALVLPRRGGQRLAEELYAGMQPFAETYGVALAGGDTNSWDGPLAISITLLGRTTERGPLVRSGARPGDKIIVTGSFGGSILGRHFDFEPRVREAIELHQRYELHAGIDVSDGLSLDLARLAAESGSAARLQLDRIPLSPAAHELVKQRADGKTALEHALSDGEDFELILAVPPAAAEQMLREQPLDVPLTVIGEFIAGAGLIAVDASGIERPLEPRGFEHELDRE